MGTFLLTPNLGTHLPLAKAAVDWRNSGSGRREWREGADGVEVDASES